MKISANISPNLYKLNTKQPQVLSQPNKDTVSFGYINIGPVPEDIQLYRTVGKSEVDVLLKGGKIPSGSYVTSNPKGWLGETWLRAFGSMNSEPYFITFKTNSLDPKGIKDRRDSLRDTRYGIGEYSLKNIANIRKGFNIHGELIYAENFEKAKKEDIRYKKAEINKLVESIEKRIEKEQKLISKLKNIFTKGKLTKENHVFFIETYIELASYAKEFPKIVDILRPIAEKSPHQNYYLMYVIKEAARKEDLEYVKSYINNSITNNEIVNDRAMEYVELFEFNKNLKKLKF